MNSSGETPRDDPSPEEAAQILHDYLHAPWWGDRHGEMEAVAGQMQEELLRIVAAEKDFLPLPGYIFPGHAVEAEEALDFPGARALQMISGTGEELKTIMKSWLHTAPRRLPREEAARRLASCGEDTLLLEYRFAADAGLKIPLMQGFGWGSSPDHLGPETRKYAWELGAGLMLSDRRNYSGAMPDQLARLDPERTKELLQNPVCLEIGHLCFWSSLRVRVRLGPPLPAEFLLDLIHHPPSKKQSPRADSIWRSAMTGLIDQRHPEALAIIEAVCADPGIYRTRRQKAWAARFEWHGREAAHDLALEHWDSNEPNRSLTGLSPEERGFVFMFLCDGDIWLGGFLNWYSRREVGCVESFSLLETRAAFASIHATSHLELLDAANAVFGSGGPPLEVAAMQERTALLLFGSRAILEDLSERWKELPDWETIAYQHEWDRSGMS